MVLPGVRASYGKSGISCRFVVRRGIFSQFAVLPDVHWKTFRKEGSKRLLVQSLSERVLIYNIHHVVLKSY